MTEVICVMCPKGCHLQVDEKNGYKVTGNGCKRGLEYGKNELICPKRVLTSTVRVEGGLHNRLPVKSDGEIPKDRIMECMRLLDGITVQCPVRVKDVIIKDVLGLGVDIVAARNL
jgi:CxxC motif-containing protein